jgi:hypothetical protein
MHTFFYDWRRKAGVITLVIACVLMGLWMRSIDVHDELWIGRHWFESKRGELDWRLFPLANPLEWRFHRIEPGPIGLVWKYSGPSYQEIVHISYCFIVLPLTLLSAYLILWKPRKREHLPS